MDSPVPFDTHSNTSWRSAGNIHSAITRRPTSAPDRPALDASGSMAYVSSTADPSIATPIEIASVLSPPTSSAGTPISAPLPFQNHLQSIHNHTSITSLPINPDLSSPFESMSDYIPRSVSTAQRTSPYLSKDPWAEHDHENAFLLRWFSEGPGYWMDLFDLGTYFASYVPVKARENPLLKYAAMAYSAKSLGRVQGKKPILGGNVTRQARMELYCDSHAVDWSHKATQYYDKAVSLLLQALKEDSVVTPPSESDCEPTLHNMDMVYDFDESKQKKRRISSNATFKPNTDELLAASAILCVYEFLDASVPEWAKHLNGAQSLLAIAQERMMPLQMPTPRSSIASTNLGFISKARRAIFWNIARQDMLAACE